MTATANRLTGADIVVRNEGLLSTEVDGELVAMSIENGACYGLNAVGTRIWALIAEPRSIDSLCAQLLTEFKVDAETCRSEVMDLIESLRAEAMVTLHKG
ncbi:MAG: PqqD family peptide modification chaperone [Pseudomonadota bacterium]